MTDKKGTYFDIVFQEAGRVWTQVFLPLHGIHNVQNALCAVAVAGTLGVEEQGIRTALKEFQGVKRRMTSVGTLNKTPIFDDYAHHPTAIKAVLKAYRPLYEGKVFVVFQPHRYSRLEGMFDAFSHAFKEADTIVVLPVYACGESPVGKTSSQDLVNTLQEQKKHAFFLETLDEIQVFLKKNATPHDVIIFMGAGTISDLAHRLPDEVSTRPTHALS